MFLQCSYDVLRMFLRCSYDVFIMTRMFLTALKRQSNTACRRQRNITGVNSIGRKANSCASVAAGKKVGTGEKESDFLI